MVKKSSFRILDSGSTHLPALTDLKIVISENSAITDEKS